MKKVTQYLGNIDANYLYEAKINYNVDDVVRVFKNNINNRNDLSSDVKSAALAKPIGRDYELVYYPLYVYKTNTSKSWNTTSTYETEDSITTTTTRHTKSGYKGTSEIKVKTDHIELNVKNTNLNNVSEVKGFGSITLNMYEDGLFYSQKENQQNGIEAGRKASGAGKGDSTYTVYTTYVIIVPILRYSFEINGKKYLFEMNLHNGEFVTSYRQKTICQILKVGLNVLYRFVTIGAFLLPLILGISKFASNGCSDAKGFTIFLNIVGLLVCIIAGFILWGFCSGKRKFTFEKIFYSPKTFFKVFLAPIIIFAVIMAFAIVFTNKAFG